MDLGVAGLIAVEQISGDNIQSDINDWLETNPDTEIIDIRFSTSAAYDSWSSDALIIYRKEVDIGN